MTPRTISDEIPSYLQNEASLFSRMTSSTTAKSSPFRIVRQRLGGLLDPFEELRAQACASGFEKLEGLLTVALRRSAEPDREHGTGRRSRMRLFTTGQGSDGSSCARRSRRICSTSGEIGMNRQLRTVVSGRPDRSFRVVDAHHVVDNRLP